MNTRRIIFWTCFFIVMILIVWGLIVAMNRSGDLSNGLGVPPEITSADYVRGPADAKVTLIEYSDFQCPACASYYSLLERLYSESSSTMRMVYRHYPLPQHQNAISSAVAAESAGRQGKFWEMSGLLFENQDEWAEATSSQSIYMNYAKELGLDLTKFQADMSLKEITDKIKNDQTSGRALGINATPTFFVNGKAINNPQNYEQFKSIIESAASSNN